LTYRALVGAYGTRLAVETSDPGLLGQAMSGLPAGWRRESGQDGVDWCFRVERIDGGFLTVDGAGKKTAHDNFRGVRQALGQELRRCVGYHTPDLTFVHAGVVAHNGRAIVLPGRSFSGKSTLVQALLRAGAEFYSDEYAVIDRAGRVMQYREPLILRGPAGRMETEIVAEGADRPLPVGLVVVTSYRSDAAWAPRRLGTADGIVAMVEHAIPARDRPAETLATLSRALADATVLVGERGEADETALALLEALNDPGPRRERPL
jgi:hypothetical protein